MIAVTRLDHAGFHNGTQKQACRRPGGPWRPESSSFYSRHLSFLSPFCAIRPNACVLATAFLVWLDSKFNGVNITSEHVSPRDAICRSLRQRHASVAGRNSLPVCKESTVSITCG